MKRLIVIGLLALLLAACQPLLVITHAKVDYSTGCVTWETSIQAQSKLTYCKDGLCYTSPLDEACLTKHCGSIPVDKNFCPKVIIVAISHDGQTATMEIP
jgi:hypothetical protein